MHENVELIASVDELDILQKHFANIIQVFGNPVLGDPEVTAILSCRS